MRTKQTGYFDFDLTGFFIALIAVGVVIGIAVSYAAPWLWSLIKPLLLAVLT